MRFPTGPCCARREARKLRRQGGNGDIPPHSPRCSASERDVRGQARRGRTLCVQAGFRPHAAGEVRRRWRGWRCPDGLSGRLRPWSHDLRNREYRGDCHVSRCAFGALWGYLCLAQGTAETSCNSRTLRLLCRNKKACEIVGLHRRLKQTGGVCEPISAPLFIEVINHSPLKASLFFAIKCGNLFDTIFDNGE